MVSSGFDTAISELAQEHRADAVVLDCSVYEMSESLFDACAATPNSPTLPVVIVSDTPEKADASLQARNAEHVLLIPKPFTGAQVARALDELLVIPTRPSDQPPSDMWSLDDWEYLQARIVTDPKGRKWTIALMDVLGQKGDPEMPSDLLQLQYASGRYFTLIYADGGALQREQGYPSLPQRQPRTSVCARGGRRTRRSVAAGVPGEPGRRVRWRTSRPLEREQN